jgi:hypothetical protein
MNTARVYLTGCGTQTEALAFGGYIPGPIIFSATEEYNGTSWTTVNSLNTARQDLGAAGTQTAALAFGGKTPRTGATEEYDGTSWATSPGSLKHSKK